VGAGEIVRVVTTGGGGWGDPLERAPGLVRYDVIEARVSLRSARDDYGVVLVHCDVDDYTVDDDATAKLRAELRARRPASLPVIDRGEGYEKMLRGGCAPRMR